jgi:hypothetical protein
MPIKFQKIWILAMLTAGCLAGAILCTTAKLTFWLFENPPRYAKPWHVQWLASTTWLSLYSASKVFLIMPAPDVSLTLIL